MSARAFGAFRTSLSGVNFLEVRSVTSSNYVGNNSTVDSSNNIYLTGRYQYGGYIPVEKINSTGVTTSFSNNVTGGTSTNSCCQSFYSISSCVDVDSSGNIYVGGTAGDTGRGTVQAYDSSGNLLWQKYIYPGSDYTYVTCVAGIKYNPVNGWVYVVTQIGTSSSFLFAALNASTGALVYNRKMSGYVGFSGADNYYYSVSNNMAVDSSGFVYVCYSSGIYVGYLKIDTGFSIQQFPVVTGLVGNSEYAQCITLDSSGNVYIGTSGNSGYLKACVIKFDSSGTYLWNATASLASTSLGFQAITTDSSGNVYCGGGGAAGNLNNNSFILKFDSSGTIQYQRNFNTDTAPIRGINMGPSNSMYFSGTFRYNYAFIGNLPTDGSKTGTYTVGSNSVTYSAGSLTIGSETLVGTTLSTAFFGAGSYGDASYTSGTFTPTVSRTAI